jgi:hypothetical protein
MTAIKKGSTVLFWDVFGSLENLIKFRKAFALSENM